jgi:Type II CAAX prenyl endopeptidase Rce1-like
MSVGPGARVRTDAVPAPVLKQRCRGADGPGPAIRQANSEVAIVERTAVGRIGWAGPLLLVFGRSALCLLAQALASGVFWLQRNPSPWLAAAPLWTVWATLADLGCLAALVWWTRREGVRLVDLFSFDRRRLRRDVLLGAGIFLVVFPVCILPATVLSSWLTFGTLDAPMYAGLLTGRILPLWAALYTACIWWPVWSVTEELTYNGYALPRLVALFRHRWLAIALVGIMWAAQHAMLPGLSDGRYLLWRTLSFLPLILALAIIYLRTRRLFPLIIGHWAMDAFSVLFTVAW